MNKQFSQRFLDLALNNKYGVIPSRADLPAWWKLIPPEIPFPRNPKLPARIAFLKTYIGQSDTKRWAGEGLLRLLREYVDNEEDSPEMLKEWVIHQYADAKRAPILGPPEKADRNLRYCAFFLLLLKRGYTREEAIYFISDKTNTKKEETVRSIILKWEKSRHFR